ncbi:MAG: hypothetical protein JNL67_22405 [Planctomycetaceae bacterium]|nr:hypothetical protein [Planctomycetaceae bacterium]
MAGVPMRLEELFVCAVCSFLVFGLIVGLYFFIKSLHQPDRSNEGTGDSSADNHLNTKHIFDRVMTIRRLFLGLPPEHWPKVLARLYDDLLEKHHITNEQCSKLKAAIPTTITPSTTPTTTPTTTLFPTASSPATEPATIPTATTLVSLEAAIPVPAQPTALNVASTAEVASAAPEPNQLVNPTVFSESAPDAPIQDPEVVLATLVPVGVPVSPSTPPSAALPVSAPIVARTSTGSAPSNRSDARAPWDMPDPTPRPPRKSLAEWSQSFMEERNIHWGELASGILIVGSALGLVLSLRRELQDTIPYFPALLFLMISLAVHYAGVYTLKRWRLRSTSRGLLLISLLLVPLNFLAGVLFNADSDSRRPLTDPWLWIALVTGTTGAGWITWSASRYLLRKGHLALFLPVMLAGLSVVVLNRLPLAEENLSRGWTLLPIAALIAGAFGSLAWLLNQRGRASSHTPTRVWILSGITLFALGNVYALYIMKQSDEPQLLSSLSPVSAIWILGLLWLMTNLNRALAISKLFVPRMICQGIAGLAWFALVVLVAWTVSCPRDLLQIVALYALSAFCSAFVFRSYWFVPIGAGFGLLTGLIGRGFVTGYVNWTDSITRGELVDLLINGRAAIMFLVVGGALSLATRWFQSYFSSQTIGKANAVDRATGPVSMRLAMQTPTERQIRRWNSLTAVGFVGVGSILGLIGAYRPTADFWDSMIGSLLLFAVALFVIGTALWGGYRRTGQTALTLVGSLLLMAASVEACFGNRQLVVYLQEALGSQRLQAELAVAISGTILAVAAWLQNRRMATSAHEDSNLSSRVEPMVRFSLVGMLLAHFGLLIAIVTLCLEQYSQPGTLLGSLIFASGLAAALLQPTRRQLGLETLTLIGLVFFSGLEFQANSEQVIQLGSGRWAFTLAGCLAGWCATMQFLATRSWLRDFRSSSSERSIMPQGFVLAAVPLLLVVMVVASLSDAVKREIWAVADVWLIPSWQMSELVDLASLVLAAWTAVLFVTAQNQFSPQNRASFMSTTECLSLGTMMLMSIWAVQGGRWDADVRAAAAVRWWMAGGSLLLAILPWCWATWRSKYPEAEGSGDSVIPVAIDSPSRMFWHDANARLQVVYTSVVVGVLSVFLVTGTAVAGFLVVGPEVRGLSPQETWLGQIRPDVSYGIPVALLLAAVLLHGISQRQSVLAIAGSYLLRLIVVFQLVLLIVSPHPQMATEWFVHIVQMVSAGMTIYGWAWYLNRDRSLTPYTVGNWLQPIQMHTWFNGALLAGLMLLVIGKYLLTPNEPLGWIQSAGNSVGLVTILLYLPLAWIVLLRGTTTSWLIPLTVVAVSTATMLVVNIERWLDFEPGVAFTLLGWFWVVIAVGLSIAHLRQPLVASVPWSWGKTGLIWSWARADLVFIWSLISFLIVAYSWRGFETFPENYWQFFGMHSMLLALGVLLGATRQSIAASFCLAPLASLWLLRADYTAPQSLLPSYLENSPSLHLAFGLLIALIWMFGNLARRYVLHQSSPRMALWFGRIVLSLSWLCLLARLGMRFPNGLESTDTLLLVMGFTYLIVALWCTRERWRTSNWAGYHFVLMAALATWLAQSQGWTSLQTGRSWLLANGIVVLMWGAAIRYWPAFVPLYRQLRIPRLAAARTSQLYWLPSAASILAGGTTFVVMLHQLGPIERWEKQLVCLAPLMSAIGFVWIANAAGQAWQRNTSVSLFTLTAVMLSWTNVPAEDVDTWLWGALIQTYWVLGVGYLAYGFAVAHWLRLHDTWRETMQRSAHTLLGLAASCLLLILLREFGDWQVGAPVFSTVLEASLVAGMTIAVAVSLIVVALVPQDRAVAESMTLRQAHVYGAQALLAVGMVHVALTMPWLFKFGLQQYWPYIAMGLAFLGIGVWHLLQRRQLTVLSEPLATTLLFFPAVAALMSLRLDSLADRSVVMLMAGLVYGVLAITHPSFWTRLTAFAFGNLALWLFIERYPLWSFQSHPQLWLIPPAVTALIVSRIEQHRLGHTAAASIRYLALAVIYVSSTSEIFIQGIGKNLAPPMILASLALLGMFAGMLLKIREYIFLGALFLLVAMFTMVWHAQQQLNHVWPWWAFGISLGIATLVFFAIFEQRRNQRRRLEPPLPEPIGNEAEQGQTERPN